MQGYLLKRDPGLVKAWKKRWFVLDDKTPHGPILYYYENQVAYEAKQTKQTIAKGRMYLPSAKIESYPDKKYKPNSFGITCVFENRIYILAALDKDSAQAWLNILNNSTNIERIKYRKHSSMT